MADRSTEDTPTSRAGARTARAADGSPPTAEAIAELPAIMLAAGYHLRLFNSWRKRLDGRGEFAVLLLILWLSAKSGDADSEVSLAAAEELRSVGLCDPMQGRFFSLREMESATGLRRETLRRTAQFLESLGWLARGDDGTPIATGKLCAWLEDSAQLDGLHDFRWTAQCVRNFAANPAISIDAARAEAIAAIRACRLEELPASFRRPVLQVPHRLIDAALVKLQGHNLRHVIALLPLFAGDLTKAILLGEIGHRNTAAMTAMPGEHPDAEPSLGLRVKMSGESTAVSRRRACNAYSLALALDIPYETVRRKLSVLCREGRLTRAADGLFWVASNLVDEFVQFNRQQRVELLATADSIDALLKVPPPAAS